MLRALRRPSEALLAPEPPTYTPEKPSEPQAATGHEPEACSAGALPEDYDRTFGDWLDDDGFEPDWHIDPHEPDVDLALRAATALLTRQADTCAALSLLPDGYLGEDVDFEEFFQPEAALQLALAVPEWGCLQDLGSRDLAGPLAEAIDATAAELRRLFDHQLPLSARLRFRLMKACRAELTLLHAELFAAAGNVVA